MVAGGKGKRADGQRNPGNLGAAFKADYDDQMARVRNSLGTSANDRWRKIGLRGELNQDGKSSEFSISVLRVGCLNFNRENG